MVVKCCSCNKKIKTTGKKLRVCKDCGRPVCWSCQIDGICKECGIVLFQNTIVGDYFAEKYKKIKEKDVVCELPTCYL